MVLRAHEEQAEQVRMKSVSNEGNFTLEVERVIVPISLRIAVGSLSNTTLYSLTMCYKQSKVG
jgi:hypothetical protein